MKHFILLLLLTVLSTITWTQHTEDCAWEYNIDPIQISFDTVPGQISIVISNKDGLVMPNMDVQIDCKWYETGEDRTSVQLFNTTETYRSNQDGIVQTGHNMRGAPKIQITSSSGQKYSIHLKESVDGVLQVIRVKLCE